MNPREETMKSFIEQELKCDPLYLAVTLGNVHLLHLKLSKQHHEEAKKLKESGKKAAPMGAIKISFKEDGYVKIEEPGLLKQSLTRAWSREGREELGLIRPHLVKLLNWFDYENKMMKTILKLCRFGLEDILQGYLNEDPQEIVITQNNPPQVPENEQHTSTLILKIQSRTPDTDFVIRILKNDIALLDEAIKENKDKRQAEDLKLKLKEEEQNYFSLYQLNLINEAKKIDAYLSEKVKERWSSHKLQGIVNLFEDVSNNFDSLSQLIAPIPAQHHELRLKMRELVTSSALPSCNFKVQYSFKEIN